MFTFFTETDEHKKDSVNQSSALGREEIQDEMRRLRENEKEVIKMREEEQVLSTEPRIGSALCPCAAQHKQKLT